MMLNLILADQSQYTLAYALVFAVVSLGFLVVCVPRPRKKVYRTAEEEKEAQNKAQKEKARAKKKKQREKNNRKRQKARAKARKKAMKG